MVAWHIALGSILVLSWLLALCWMFQGVTGIVGMATLPDLTRIDATDLAELEASGRPDLTVVAPACNEEEAIEATLRSLLASTGIRLQIVAVNDRSIDRTGERMDVVAAGARGGTHEIEVIHNHELASGWLGKTHALYLGVERSRAPWVLMTDGDVTFSPAVLGLALRHAMSVGTDHLVLIPTLLWDGIGEGAMHGTIQALAQWAVRLWKVKDQGSKDALGVGGFTLIRRETLDAVGGVKRMRMEVVEDVSLGFLVKGAGYRSSVALGPGLVKIRWMRGFLGIVGNMEKNGFAGFRYRLRVAVAAVLALLIQAVIPLAAMFLGGWGLAAGLINYVGITLTMIGTRKLSGISPIASLLYAPCILVVAWALGRSTVLTIWRGGVVWRGTYYPLSELRKNAVQWKQPG
jgi:cellulose synthase/poly-beta-1,6-N-acetylglucosamine synthase-like glycosyltransferase